MIVVDASAAIELVLGTPAGDEVTRRIREHAPPIVPAHFDADAYAGLRRMMLRRDIDRALAASAVTLVAAFPAERFGCQPLLARAFALVDRIGAHDAFYVVLAERLGCALLTCDDALRRVAPSGVRTLMVQPTTSH